METRIPGATENLWDAGKAEGLSELERWPKPLEPFRDGTGPRPTLGGGKHLY
jgi:hypothetical protein